MPWNDYADQVQKKVLDAVSSLKRATGCPDSPKLKDAFVEDSTNLINIYTTDHDSANILSNAVSQCVSQARGVTNERKLVKEEEKHAYSLAEIIPVKGGAFKVVIDCPPAFTLALADRINEKAQSLI